MAELTVTDLAVYRALLLEPDRSLDDVASALELPGDDVRATLDRLARLGLLQPSQESAGELRVTSPDVSLARLVRDLSLDLQERQLRLAELQLDAARLSEDYREARRTASANVLTELASRDAVVGALAEVIDTTTEELLVMVTNRQSELALVQARETDQMLLDRGVTLRGVYVSSVLFDKPTVKYLDWMTSAGAQVRIHPAPPIRLVISDRRTAVVARDSEDPSNGAFLVRAPGLVHALVALHEFTWRAASDVESDGAAGDLGDGGGGGGGGGAGGGSGAAHPEGLEGPSSVDLEILRLLGRGQKDDAVARQLAMSVRTLRRLIGDLAHQTGARSRFELGVIARDRGWI